MLIFIILVLVFTHEKVRGYSECSPNEFQCYDGSCIYKEYFCDFHPDCNDQSDEINCFLECILSQDDKGYKYSGKRNITAFGRTCQRYDQQYPHEHKYGYRDATEENYCRNEMDSYYPWCYTMDPDIRWEPCAIPKCRQLEEKSCSFEKGMCDWRQPRNNQVPWVRQMNQMDSSTGETVLAVDLSKGTEFSESYIYSPVIASSVEVTCFRLFYSTYTSRDSILEVFITYGQNENKLIASRRGNTLMKWEKMEIPITEQNQYGIIIKARSLNKGAGVIALDDFSLKSGDCSVLTICSEYEYECDDHTCIDVHYFCDGYPDCPDHSDELNCEIDCLPKYDLKGFDYAGEMNVTMNGRACQRWEMKISRRISNESENYCRNPDGSQKPWCFTNESGIGKEFCDVPYCEFECLQKSDPHGIKYYGTLDRTESGIKCQRWDAQKPHEHRYSAWGEHENYCRNMDDGGDKLWCYTVDPDVRWDFCYLPNCEMDCLPSYDLEGIDYAGKMNVTINGHPCQLWEGTMPSHVGNQYENYCRNPDGSEKPWCYTDENDFQREYCDIAYCEFDCLQKSDPRGIKYHGTLDRTKSGIKCQQWGVQKPHEHKYGSWAEHENYCRNIDDGGDNLWCYTVDPDVRWELCYLPICVPRACSGGVIECQNKTLNNSDGNMLYTTTDSVSTQSAKHITRDLCLDGFKCRDSNLCLNMEYTCDGFPHCPHNDDELMCNVTCPDDCTCNGLVYRCFSNKQTITAFENEVRTLSISGASFNVTKFLERKLPFLIHLNIHDTNISSINDQNVFVTRLHSNNLQSLRLGNNKIRTVSRFAFAGLFQLRQLYLDNNPIINLDGNMFGYLNKLVYLTIADTLLSNLDRNLFNGLSNLKVLNLSRSNIETIQSETLHKLSSVSDFDFSHNKLIQINKYFSLKMSGLLTADLSYNEIEELTKESLDGLFYVQKLNFGHNRIKVIRENTFVALYALRILDLSFNSLYLIEKNGFWGQSSLQSLDLQGNKLLYISQDIFYGLSDIQYLNLNSNNLHIIDKNTFSNLGNLEILYLQDNDILVYKEMFYGLCKLKSIYADSYTICCAKPPSVTQENCIAPADRISSCDHLIDVGLLSVSIWFIAVFTIGGNIFVIIYRCFVEKENKFLPHVILILNLSVSDFLMGVYLLIIAITDLRYRGDYGYFDQTWRSSTVCVFSGVLATVSSESSALLLLFITIDRVIAMKFPFARFRMTKMQSAIIAVTVWVIATCISIIPMFFHSYYSNSSVCISLPLSKERKPGWEYSVGLFIVFNLILFIGIVTGQFLIYFEVRNVGKRANKTSSNEAAVAKTLFSLAFTDALCWIPIAILGLVTLYGYEISSSIYAWVVVLILPLNSALNPFLYTVSAIRAKQKLRSDAETKNAEWFRVAKIKGKLLLIFFQSNNYGLVPSGKMDILNARENSKLIMSLQKLVKMKSNPNEIDKQKEFTVISQKTEKLPRYHLTIK